MIFSNEGAFAALLDDGTVVAWGFTNGGGKIPRDIKNKIKKKRKNNLFYQFCICCVIE